MKRTVIAVSITALAVAGADAASAQPGKSPGNGAQKAGLAAVSGDSLTGCHPAEGAGKQTATGFAILNAPGKPGQPKKIVGDVAVKDAEPGTYDLNLAAESGCGEKVGELVVGQNRQGNASIAAPAQGAGVYYVTLTQQPLTGVPVAEGLYTAQSYASGAVTLR